MKAKIEAVETVQPEAETRYDPRTFNVPVNPNPDMPATVPDALRRLRPWQGHIARFGANELGYPKAPLDSIEHHRRRHLMRVYKVDVKTLVEDPRCAGLEYNNLRKQIAEEARKKGYVMHLTYAELCGLLKPFKEIEDG